MIASRLAVATLVVVGINIYIEQIRPSVFGLETQRPAIVETVLQEKPAPPKPPAPVAEPKATITIEPDSRFQPPEEVYDESNQEEVVQQLRKHAEDLVELESRRSDLHMKLIGVSSEEDLSALLEELESLKVTLKFKETKIEELGQGLGKQALGDLVATIETELKQRKLEREAVKAEHRQEELDFSKQSLVKADFSGQDLRGADFSRAMLTGANFQGADLSGADLHGAHMQDADFTGAILVKADLHRARMESAVLRDADLRGANLERARLLKADLTNADLRGARTHNMRLEGATMDGMKSDELERLE